MRTGRRAPVLGPRLNQGQIHAYRFIYKRIQLQNKKHPGKRIKCRILRITATQAASHRMPFFIAMSEPIEQPGLNGLSKSFEPAALEAHWGPEWERRGYGVAGHRGTGQALAGAPAFAIQLPPPNVTGTLHMGHAFNQTIMDSLTRYHRMLGHNTVWVPGTDHAGIATQIVVERQLQGQGTSRHDLGRELQPTPPRTHAALPNGSRAPRDLARVGQRGSVRRPGRPPHPQALRAQSVCQVS